MKTTGQKLNSVIEMLAIVAFNCAQGDTSLIEQDLDRAKKLLARLAPETMSQEEVGKRWPRLLSAMIVSSDGYYTPRAAANALLAYKLKQSFGCEWHCAAAGFERDGWPHDHDVYERKLRETGERLLGYAVRRHFMHHSEYDEQRFAYSRKLVAEMSGGAYQPPALLASWF